MTELQTATLVLYLVPAAGTVLFFAAGMLLGVLLRHSRR